MSAYGCSACYALHGMALHRIAGLREFFLMLRKADLLDTIISSVKALQVRSGRVGSVPAV